MSRRAVGRLDLPCRLAPSWWHRRLQHRRLQHRRHVPSPGTSPGLASMGASTMNRPELTPCPAGRPETRTPTAEAMQTPRFEPMPCTLSPWRATLPGNTAIHVRRGGAAAVTISRVSFRQLGGGGARCGRGDTRPRLGAPARPLTRTVGRGSRFFVTTGNRPSGRVHPHAEANRIP